MFRMDEDGHFSLSQTQSQSFPVVVDISNISQSFNRHQVLHNRIRQRYHKKRSPIYAQFPPWIQIIGFEVPGSG